MIAITAALAVGWVVTTISYERMLRRGRTELNHAKAQEAVLLNRLASRSVHEFAAITHTTSDVAGANPGWLTEDEEAAGNGKIYLSDPTGLFGAWVDDDVPEAV